jgi:hypothetical protein
MEILTCTTLMHIEVSARPNTRYTMDAIIYMGCWKHMKQNITMCMIHCLHQRDMSLATVFVSLTRISVIYKYHIDLSLL